MNHNSRSVFSSLTLKATAIGRHGLIALALIACNTPWSSADDKTDQWEKYLDSSKEFSKGLDLARRNAAQALHIAEQFGSTDPRYIKSLYQLADVDRFAGNLRESESLLQKSLQCMDKQSQSRETIKANRLAAMILLAEDYDEDNRPQLSDSLWKKILLLVSEVDLEDQAETSECLRKVAQHYLLLNDMDSANKYTDQFLEICRRSHRSGIGEMERLIGCYESFCVRSVMKNDLKAAETALQMGLKVAQFIPDRTVSKCTICGLAAKLCDTYDRENNKDRERQFAGLAERSAVEALGIHQADLDSDRLKLPTNDEQRKVFDGLALINHTRGRYVREEYFYKQTIKSREEESAKNPRRDVLNQLAGSYFVLGRFYYERGRNKEAAVTLNKSLAVMERLGKGAPFLGEIEPMMQANFQKLHNEQAAKAAAARIAKLKLLPNVHS